MKKDKPYYYMRNGLLHCKYVVDKAVELSEDEVLNVKNEFAKAPFDKQEILERQWELQVKLNGKKILDGVEEVNRRIEESRKYYEGLSK